MIRMVGDNFICLLVVSKKRHQCFGLTDLVKKVWLKCVDAGSQFEETVKFLGVKICSCPHMTVRRN